MAIVNTESAPSSQARLGDGESGRSDTSLTCGFNTHERNTHERTDLEAASHIESGPSYAAVGTVEAARMYAQASKCQEGESRASHERLLPTAFSG